MAGRRGGQRGIPVANSMFACLKLEEVQDEKTATQPKKIQQNGSQHNKNEKKNTNNKPSSSSKSQLQQLAFAKPSSAGKKKQGKNVNANCVKPKEEEQDWTEWKKHDKEVVEDQFKEDLRAALLESRLEFAQKKVDDKEKQQRIEAGIEEPTTKAEKKKKKQKDKAKPMSVEEFNKLPPPVRKTSSSDESDEDTPPSKPPVHYTIPPAQKDTNFFNKVQNDAEDILKQDRMQEEYRKTFSADNVVIAKLNNDLELKDQKIAELTGQMEKMEAKMKQVKQRNKQLCFILGQGEMKDKAQALMQVEELNKVKDELTEQVTSLTAELEKEKSKNRALKTESDKIKGSKQGK